MPRLVSLLHYVRHRTDPLCLFDYIVIKVSSQRVGEARYILLRHTGLSIENRNQAVPVLLTSGESTMNTFTKTLSAAFLAISLVSVVGCASTSQQEGTGQYIDDTVITAKVKAALIEDPTTKATEINVETFKGVVQLSGFVISQAAIDRAVELARGVAGVKSVKNDMRIK